LLQFPPLWNLHGGNYESVGSGLQNNSYPLGEGDGEGYGEDSGDDSEASDDAETDSLDDTDAESGGSTQSGSEEDDDDDTSNDDTDSLSADDGDTSDDDTDSDDGDDGDDGFAEIEDDDECANLSESECNAASYDDEGNQRCAYNAVRGKCNRMVPSEGAFGSGNFDDGFLTARNQSESDTSALYAMIGVLGGVIAILVLIIIVGGWYCHKKKSQRIVASIETSFE